jgi:phage gp29-like protein
MPFLQRLTDAAKAMMGVSVYVNQSPMSSAVPTDEEQHAALRKAMGGQLQPIASTPTEWYLADLQEAQKDADSGNLQKVARLWRSMRRDGMLYGLMKTRTSGLVALPKRWRGDEKQIEELKSENNGSRPIFDEMFPPEELAQMAADGIVCGVAIGEMVPVVGRSHPKLVRLDPEFLQYIWTEDTWYYSSVIGREKITPGNGRWILHVQGSYLAPWQHGVWAALGRAFIAKEHALLHRANFSAKLANPARVARAPLAATERQREGFLASLMRWGVNTVFELPPGWEVDLVESNGRGWEVFGAEVDTANQEFMVTLAGQVVTTEGGTGFSNAGIHATITADLIKETADCLAYTINTQGIPPWVIREYGEAGLTDCARIEWDIAPPADRMQEAAAMTAFAGAVTQLTNALRPYEMRLDVEELNSRFGIPIVVGEKPPEVEESLQPGNVNGVAAPKGRLPTSPPSGESKERKMQDAKEKKAA